MKRRLFVLAAALSLLLSLAGAAAWVMSHARPSGWRLIGTAHSADLTRVSGAPHTALFTTTVNWSTTPNHGFWDAWWALTQSGRLTLLAQVVDYEGTLRRVHSSPPSLTVELPVPTSARAVVFNQNHHSGPSAGWLGFALQSDAQMVNGVSARAWMLTLPCWFIVLLGLPLPLLWWRHRRAR